MAEVRKSAAASRRSTVRSAENTHACGLTPKNLAAIDVVIDFTSPTALSRNIEACIRAKKNLVVGTTGWYDQSPRFRKMVSQRRPAFFTERIFRSA